MNALSHVFDSLLTFLLELVGKYGFFGLFFAMILQSIISPLPSEIVMAVGAAGLVEKYGYFWGSTLAFFSILLGAMVGALIAFWIGWKGEELITKKVEPQLLLAIEHYLEKHGFVTIVLARLIPFLSFDAISYAAGFFKIPRKSFLLATLIGLIPRTLFYVLLGSGFIKLAEKSLNLALLVAFVIAVILLALAYAFQLWIRKKNFSISAEATEATKKSASDLQ